MKKNILTFFVILALTMSHEIDGSWNDVKIVQKEYYSARKISINAIGDNLTTDFKNLDVTQLQKRQMS